MEAGLTVTTLNPAYTMPEVARQLEMSKAKIILTEESRVAAVKEAMNQIGILPENHQKCRIFVPKIATNFEHKRSSLRYAIFETVLKDF